MEYGDGINAPTHASRIASKKMSFGEEGDVMVRADGRFKPLSFTS